MENTPLVVDGIMYTGTALEVVALDAVTGREDWKLNRALDPKVIDNAYEVNKGVAIAGDTLVLGYGRLPPDRDRCKNGQMIWDKTLADYRKGYQYNVPPLVVRDKMFFGRPTNQAGANCWVSAYDIKTGKKLLALRHRPDIRGCAGSEDLDAAIRGSTGAVRSGTPAATTRKRTGRSGGPAIRIRAGTATFAHRRTTCIPPASSRSTPTPAS